MSHLIAVAEEGSLAAAARRLHLTQPALTRSIQALEAETELPVFDRGPRGVTLTAAGHMMVERARRILFEARCLERDIELMRKNEMGSVRLGMGPLPAAILLSGALATMNREWPGLNVVADVSGGAALLTALHNESLDFVVVESRTLPRTVDLRVCKLPAEPAGWFVRWGHPLLPGPASPEQMQAATLVSVPLPAKGHARLRRWLGYRPGEDLPFKVECNDFHSLTLSVLQSDAVLLAPWRALAEQLKAGTLVPLEVAQAGGPAAMEFVIAHLAQRTLSPAAERAVATIRAVAAR
ncbi:MAG: Chromosome initiation inhibitor [Variovorax sp.]|nr:Chromosome initiation inhibitor [Variovorax sp.]